MKTEENSSIPVTESFGCGCLLALAGGILETYSFIVRGGVFANVILQERCRQLLEKDGFKVYVNEQVPGNDGGIALGQAWLAAERLMDEKDRGGQICV